MKLVSVINPFSPEKVELRMLISQCIGALPVDWKAAAPAPVVDAVTLAIKIVE